MAASMKCCANCFGDRGLRRGIIPIFASSTGTCSYCGSQDENLVSPNDLKDYFELIISIYTQDDNGISLVEWLKLDWTMFDHPQMDVAHAKELLSDILNDGEIVRQSFVPSELCISDRLDSWGEFRNELMYENRFFPDTTFDLSRLEELFSHLHMDKDELPESWYRARIQESDSVYSVEEMSAPPQRKATHGRANPAGIPYLYLASTISTAVSEIRPHTGEIASVADFTITPDLTIVDLRDPRKTVSPFVLADEREVALLRGDIEFLEHLGEELTRPVLPQAAAIDYIPSQYLCEYIKKCGYDGVVYRSSVGDGVNLALFEPDRAAVGTVIQRRVSRVTVELER